MVQRREDPDCREERSGDVTDRGTDTYRRSLRFTRNANDTPHALDNHVVGTLLGIGTGLSKAGTRRVDERWMFDLQRVVIQPQFLHRPRTEVLNEDIGLLQ